MRNLHEKKGRIKGVSGGLEQTMNCRQSRYQVVWSGTCYGRVPTAMTFSKNPPCPFGSQDPQIENTVVEGQRDPSGTGSCVPGTVPGRHPSS